MEAFFKRYTLRVLTQMHFYERRDCIVFRKTKESFGGLSNMAAGYPISINGRTFLTSEALYQCCRYPHRPDIQEEIVRARSPMHAKMISKRYRRLSRTDWEDEITVHGEPSQVRIEFMRWCLQLKLASSFGRFGKLLLRTGSMDIVEESARDSFWGAIPREDNILEGRNVLGKLLMELRDALAEGFFSEMRIIDLPSSLKVYGNSEFALFGIPVQPVRFEPVDMEAKVSLEDLGGNDSDPTCWFSASVDDEARGEREESLLVQRASTEETSTNKQRRCLGDLEARDTSEGAIDKLERSKQLNLFDESR